MKRADLEHDADLRPLATRGIIERVELTSEQRAWLERDEALWRRAHDIARAHPELDVSGVYHTLINFERHAADRQRAAV